MLLVARSFIVWASLPPLLTPSLVAAETKAAQPFVPGFERFFAEPKADLVRGGRLLLGELNCTSCHQADASLNDQILKKQAPVLDGVGNRVKRGYLRKYLADPDSMKPGATMPDL